MNRKKSQQQQAAIGESAGPLKRITIGLNAAIVSVVENAPQILTVPHDKETGKEAGEDGSDAAPGDTLPFGPFDPLSHRTLEQGLRAWVEEQTRLRLGYVEQLYTFGDRGRHAAEEDPSADHVVSVGYLALTRGQNAEMSGAKWSPWYQYFPWEDWREGKPAIIDKVLVPLLREWAAQTGGASAEEIERGRRLDRLRLCFGIDGVAWDEEKVLERYELLYSSGLVIEAYRDGRPQARKPDGLTPQLGRAMQFDHRRILATAMGRVRAKLKYRPVIFELMPETFTLFELQQMTEALLGLHVHKQNFRRLVEKAGLVERTGRITTRTGGRPAEQFRFRREILNERPAPGLKLAPSRSRVNNRV